MSRLTSELAQQLSALSIPVQLELPDGRRFGPQPARVTLGFSNWSSLAKLAARQVGAVGEDFVEGRVRVEGHMRDLVAAAAALLPGNPVETDTGWWARLLRRARSRGAHTPQRDAAQIEFHYDVSDDFYALWLDPRRVYSCAYFPRSDTTLAQAQEAKLDLICRKLMLAPGERFLDIGSGWGGLLLWAAEHYGVDATGITLSRNQHAHVQGLIEARGLQRRVRVELCDYRELPPGRSFDKIASVGMFEHVGRANMATYFARVRDLLAPGGMVLNHGITAAHPAHRQLGAGMGDFIEKYIFPGGELLHVSEVLREAAASGLEMVDTENLRPHYARTLWAWSDALEARLPRALELLSSGQRADAAAGRAAGADRAARVLRAYRLYLAGSAMSFEQGWISLHQILATRPDGALASGSIRGAQSGYPFVRDYIYRSNSMLYRFKSQATAEVVMLEANARHLLEIMGKTPGAQGIVTVDQMPAALAALEAAVRQEAAHRHNGDEHAQEAHEEDAERQHVSLHQRAAPLIDMIKRSHAEGQDVVWGV